MQINNLVIAVSFFSVCLGVKCIAAELNKRCYFPFIYEGKNYSTCILINNLSSDPNKPNFDPWCAMKPKYNTEYLHDWCYCGKSDLLYFTYKLGNTKSLMLRSLAKICKDFLTTIQNFTLYMLQGICETRDFVKSLVILGISWNL